MVGIVLLAVLALGAVLVAREFRQVMTRPAVQRGIHRHALDQMAEALRCYRNDKHSWPDNLLNLFQHAGLNLGANHGYQYRKPPADVAEQYVVMWSDAWLPGAKAGDPWTETQRAERDIPPVVYALDAGLRVVEMSLDDAKTRLPRPPSIEAK